MILACDMGYHYNNLTILHSAIFHGCKNDNSQMKNCDILFILAQNIDRGYTLEHSSEYLRSMF